MQRKPNPATLHLPMTMLIYSNGVDKIIKMKEADFSSCFNHNNLHGSYLNDEYGSAVLSL